MTDILASGHPHDGDALARPLSQAQPHAATRPGKVRPFWQGFLLAVVTLGLYHFWWHWLTHAEVKAALGENDRAGAHWFGYIGALVASAFVAGFSAARVPGLLQSEVPSSRFAQWELMMELGRSPALDVTLWIAMVLFFVTFVARQGAAINALHQANGLPGSRPVNVGGVVAFFIVAEVVAGFQPLVSALVGVPVAMLAYSSLQSGYNDVWNAIHHTNPPRETPRVEARIIEVGRDSEERPIYENRFGCPACGHENLLVGLEGDLKAHTCPQCGKAGTVAITGPPDDAPRT